MLGIDWGTWGIIVIFALAAWAVLGAVGRSIRRQSGADKALDRRIAEIRRENHEAQRERPEFVARVRAVVEAGRERRLREEDHGQ